MRCPKCKKYGSLEASHPNSIGPHDHNNGLEKDEKGCGKTNWVIGYNQVGVLAVFCKFCDFHFTEIICECGATLQGNWLAMDDGPACPACDWLGSTGLDGKSKCSECGWELKPPDPSEGKSGAYPIWVSLIVLVIFISLLAAVYFAFQ